MKLLRQASNIFDRLIDVLALVAIVIMASVTVLIVVEVTSRYFFNLPIKGSVEVAGYSLLFITFLGTAWLLRREGHVRMDFVLTRLNPRAQAYLNVITSLLCALIWVLIGWYGATVTLESFQTGYRTPFELKTPMFIILFIIPVGSFLLFIQFLRRGYGYLREWRTSSDALRGEH